MTSIDFAQPAELFLGTSRSTARALGSRRFSSVEAAIRFAVDQAAPASLKGALLRIGDRRLDGRAIRALYERDSRFARRELPEVSALEHA